VLKFAVRDLERVSARNRDLRRELEANLLLSKQLLEDVSVHSRQLAGVLTQTRFKLALNRAEPIDTSIVNQFPASPFTVEELERANPNIPREEVRMHLAYRVSLREVSFFSRSVSDEPGAPAIRSRSPVRLLYRVVKQNSTNEVESSTLED